jgi:RNA polymerase primary sigma factor
VAPEDEFDRLQQLVEEGKEKGYVAYEDLADALPADLANGTELGNLLAGLDGNGIELLEDPKLEFDQKLEESEDLLDLDLGPSPGEKVNDPVRTYLREMGTVPLLSREGETEIARRIERGQNTVIKELSRSPLVIQEVLDMAEEVRRCRVRGRPARHRRGLRRDR